MLAVLLAAEEALPNQSAWWEITAAWFLRIGALAAAFAGVAKVMTLLFGRAFRDWQEARYIRHNRPLIDAIGENTREIRKVDVKVDARHRSNHDTAEELGRSVRRLEFQMKDIHKRIDAHMDEEREERHQDRAELMGFLQQVAMMRRDDVQALRDRSEQRKEET